MRIQIVPAPIREPAVPDPCVEWAAFAKPNSSFNAMDPMDLLAHTAHALSEGAHGPTEPERQSRTRPISSELAASSDAQFRVLSATRSSESGLGPNKISKHRQAEQRRRERINDR
jgi:hypothetical protein